MIELLPSIVVEFTRLTLFRRFGRDSNGDIRFTKTLEIVVVEKWEWKWIALNLSVMAKSGRG